MAEISFNMAPEIISRVKKILDEAEFSAVRQKHFVTIFTDANPDKAGRRTYGTAQVIRGKTALLYWHSQGKGNDMTPFFLITINSILWKELGEEGRDWLVRHELRHCTTKSGKKSKNSRLVIKAHDVEVFLADLKNPAFQSVQDIWKVVQDAGQLSLIDAA